MTSPVALIPPRIARGRWALVIALLSLAIMVVILVIRLSTNLVDPGVAEGAGGDFRDATYFPVQALLDGVNPYDPEAYLASNADIGQYFPAYAPHHLLIHLPFIALSLTGATAVYAVLTLVLTGALAWVSLGLAGIERTAPVVLGLAALVLATNAGRANFIDLQPTIIVVLGVYLAIAHRNRPWLAGLGVALSMIKPQFGIPLVVIMGLTGQLQAAWRGLVIAAASSAPIVVRLIDIEGGPSGLIEAIGNNLRYADEVGRSYLRIDVLGSFGISSVGASVMVGAIVVVGAAFVLRASDRSSSPGGLVVLTGSILLVLFHVSYDLLLLTWPILAVAVAAGGNRDGRQWRWLLVALLVLMFNPLTSAFMIDKVGPANVLGALAGLGLATIVPWAATLRAGEPIARS